MEYLYWCGVGNARTCSIRSFTKGCVIAALFLVAYSIAREGGLTIGQTTGSTDTVLLLPESWDNSKGNHRRSMTSFSPTVAVTFTSLSGSHSDQPYSPTTALATVDATMPPLLITSLPTLEPTPIPSTLKPTPVPSTLKPTPAPSPLPTLEHKPKPTASPTPKLPSPEASASRTPEPTSSTQKNSTHMIVFVGDSTMRRLTAAVRRASNGDADLVAPWFPTKHACRDVVCYAENHYDKDNGYELMTAGSETTYVLAPSWWVVACFGRKHFRWHYSISGLIEDPNDPKEPAFPELRQCKQNMAWLQQHTSESVTIENWLRHTYVAMYKRACASKKRVIITTPILAGRSTENYNHVNPYILKWAADASFRDKVKSSGCNAVTFLDQATPMRFRDEATRDPLYGTDGAHGIHVETNSGMLRRVQIFQAFL